MYNSGENNVFRLMKKYILLDNIRSILNVGAIFRTCDGAGFDCLYLTGFTPVPPRKEISKTAIGAEKWIDWEYYEDPEEILAKLQSQGVLIIVLEQDERSIDFRDSSLPKDRDICIVVGNEIEGVSKKILEMADYHVEIPMLGKKQSLNVATAAGILMYRFV